MKPQDGFKGKFDDFKYKHGEKLDEEFNNQCDFKTNVRGVKVRGVFDVPVKQKEEQSAFKQKTVVSHLLDRWDIGYHGTLVPKRY